MNSLSVLSRLCRSCDRRQLQCLAKLTLAISTPALPPRLKSTGTHPPTWSIRRRRRHSRRRLFFFCASISRAAAFTVRYRDIAAPVHVGRWTLPGTVTTFQGPLSQD